MARGFKNLKEFPCGPFNPAALFQPQVNCNAGKRSVFAPNILTHLLLIFGIKASDEVYGAFFLQHLSCPVACANPCMGELSKQVRCSAAVVKM